MAKARSRHGLLTFIVRLIVLAIVTAVLVNIGKKKLDKVASSDEFPTTKQQYEQAVSEQGQTAALKAVLDPDAAGYLFMPADQPLVLPASLRKLADQFAACPSRAVRLGFEKTAGSPVLFPAYFRDDLLAYTGDRGGMEVLRQKHLPCDVVQASFTWELWDVDTPEKMEMVKKAWFSHKACFS